MNIAPVERFSDATLRLPPCALAPSPHIHLYVGEHTAALLPACSSSSPFRESTRDDYRRDLRRYVLPYFDGKQRKRVDEITPRDAAEFVGWLCDAAEQGRRVAVERRKAKAQKLRVSPGSLPLESQPLHLADASVRRILSPLRACMGSAVAEGVIRSNPTLGVALPARDEQRAIDAGTDEEEHQVKALSTEELAAFLMVCPERWETFFGCSRQPACGSLRHSRCAGAICSSTDLSRMCGCDGLMCGVDSAHQRAGMESGLCQSTTPLSSTLRARRKDAEWAEDDDLVFPPANGEPLRQENVRRRVLKPVAEEAGVPWAGFHTFRHTCATRLFAGGRNAVQMQRWLGHHSPAFTLSVYVDLLDGDVGEALPLDLPSSPEDLPKAGAEAQKRPVAA